MHPSAMIKLWLLLELILSLTYISAIPFNRKHKIVSRSKQENFLCLRSKGTDEMYAKDKINSRPSKLQNREDYLNYFTEIDKYYDSKPLEVWQRALDIGSPLAGWYILRKLDNITSYFRSEDDNRAQLLERAADFKNSIVQGKSVAFIKSGQALALRPDIVKSPEYVQELTKLQDEVGTFSNDIAMQIFREELGVNASELVDFESQDPIASASIGQVYKARLKSSGKLVAVKIQRPDILDYTPIDLYILRKLASYLKKKYKLRSNILGIANEFGVQLFGELNYTQEALNCIRFKELYSRIPNIYVPDVYLNMTTNRVLTMEFVEGTKGPWESGGEKMLTVGLQCSVLQLLESGFFHADPHRGNLLQTPNGQLAYLDFGMMSYVESKQRYALIGTVLGLVNKDISLVIENMKVLKFFPPETDSKVIVEALTSALANSTSKGQVSSLNFTQLNQNIESISYLLPIQLPPFYTLIIRTLTILEGLALYVDPKFRLIRGAYPFIAKQILSSPSPELGELLKAVIVNKEGRIKWSKLEQFISISSNADAALAGNFKALQYAQERSDLLRTYGGTQIEGNFTYEVTLQIIDFLLTENGRYLREPLVDELVDTIDSLGLTSLSLLSFFTNGIVPQPSVKPDRQRVTQFVKFIGIILNNALSKSNSNSKDNLDDLSAESIEQSIKSPFVWNKSIVEYSNLRDIFAKLINFLTGSNSLDAQIDPLLQKIFDRSSVLISEITRKLIDRNARRVVRTVAGPEILNGFIPFIAKALDFIPKSDASKKKI